MNPRTRFDISKKRMKKKIVLNSFDRRTPCKNRPKKPRIVKPTEARETECRQKESEKLYEMKMNCMIFWKCNEEDRPCVSCFRCSCAFDVFAPDGPFPNRLLTSRAAQNNKSENIKEIKMCDNFFIYLLNAFFCVFLFFFFSFCDWCICAVAQPLHFYTIRTMAEGGILCMG